MRLLEPPLPIARRTRECAANVAEKLRFEQRFGDGAAIERDEPVHPPRAVVVNRSGDHFLARAGLARDENRAVRSGDRLDELQQTHHRPTLSDDPVEAIAFVELRAQIRVLGFQPPLLDRRLENVQQLVDLKWFVHEIPRAALDRIDRVLHGAVSGNDDGDDVGITIDGSLYERRAVHPGQPQIRNDHVEREFGEQRDGPLARVGLLDPIPAIGELLGDGLPQRRLVFNEKQMFCRISHLRTRQHSDTASISCPDLIPHRNAGMANAEASTGRYIPAEAKQPCGTKNHFHHEGM